MFYMTENMTDSRANNIAYSMQRLKDQKGQVVVIVAILVVVMAGISALVIDEGSLYQERRLQQTVADAAALAGAQELPEDPDKAIQIAVDYAASHGVDVENVYVEIDKTLVPNDTIKVRSSDPDASVYFGRVLGVTSADVEASATAMVGRPLEVYDVVPWGAFIPRGVNWQEWLKPGEDKILKFGAGESVEGNFYALDLDGRLGGGSNDYVDRIINGYPEPLSVGDIVLTEPGNMAKTVSATNERVGTWDSFEDLVTYNESGDIIKLARNDSQFVVVPVIYELEDPKGQERVEILAFAPFILDRIEGHGGQAQIVGKFIHQALIVTAGEVGGAQSLGLKVVRLLK